MSSGQKIVNLFCSAGIGLLKNFWIFLALLLFAQIGLLYIAVSDIRIPDFIVKRILEKTEAEGFYVSVGDVRLRNLTVITARDLSIGTSRGNDPFLRARRCAVKLGPDALISGNPVPQLIYAAGTEYLCPSIISPTGKSERIFSEGTLILRKSEEKIMVDAAEFCLGDAKFVVYGELSLPALFSGEVRGLSENPADSSRAEKPSVLISRFAGTLSEKLHTLNLRALLNSCEFVAEIRPDGDVHRIALSAFCEDFDFQEKFHLKKISAEQNLSIDFLRKKILFSAPVCVFAESGTFSFGELFSERILGGAKHISFAARLPENIFDEGVPVEKKLPNTVFSRIGHLRLATFDDGVFNIESLLLAVSPVEKFAFPGEISVRANASLGTTTFACAGSIFADPEKSWANLAYEASVDKNLIFEFPQLREIAQHEDLYALKFSEQPDLRGNVRFAPGMNFESVDFELLAGETQGNNFRLCALNVAGTLSPTEIRFPKIIAEGSDFCAKADAFFEFADDGTFRVRAWGTVNPEYIDDRLGWFWERIWRDLKKAPSEQSPRGDFDVYGRWSDNWEYVFGAVAGEKCYGNGVLVDKVCLRVYEDPLLITAYDMHFERGNDVVEGCLQWHYAMEPQYHYRDFRFLFNGTMPPAEVLQIVGEGLPEAISDIETEGAATGTVRGFFSGDPEIYPDRLFVEIKGAVPGKFSVFGMQGENFRGEIVYDNGTVLVGDPFFTEIDDGDVSGKIKIKLPVEGDGVAGSEADLDLVLRNISRSRLKDTLNALVSRSNGALSPAEKSVPVVSADHFTSGPIPVPEEVVSDKSRIDAHFKGRLTVPDLNTLDANGTFSMRDEDLFELQIFGGFSRLLSTLKIDLTTFPMDRAESSFSVKNGMVGLPDTRIFGESGEINIQADISLSDFSVQGEAVFRNLRGTGIPLFGKLVEWGSASTELLPVKLSGTVENLDWALTPKLSRIWDWVNPSSLLKLPNFSREQDKTESR